MGKCVRKVLTKYLHTYKRHKMLNGPNGVSLKQNQLVLQRVMSGRDKAEHLLLWGESFLSFQQSTNEETMKTEGMKWWRLERQEERRTERDKRD